MDGLEEAGCAVSLSAQDDDSRQVAYVNFNSNSNAINKPAVLNNSNGNGRTSTASKATLAPNDRWLDERAQNRMKTVGLSVLILIALGLLCLPIAFYHIRNNKLARDTSEIQVTCERLLNVSATECGLQQCRNASLLASAGGIDKDSLIDLFYFLMLLASDDCRAAAVPFACQFLFPFCDANERPYLPSAQQCVNVTTDVCADIWPRAPSAQVLSTCERLPGISTCAVIAIGDELPKMTCRENFFLSNSSRCLAQCDSWEQSSRGVTEAVKTVELFSALFGLLASIIVIVVSFLRRKTMFTFPSILIVYMTLGYSVVALFVIVTYIERGGLYCGGSKSVIDAVQNPTAFCTATGVVLHYFILNITLWWFFHVTSIFWKLQFPIHARKLQKGENLKYIHVAVVIAGLLIPLPGVVATSLTEGYTITRFPPILCGTRNSDAGYYSVYLIMNILLAVGISMLIIMFWIVHKQQGFIRYKETSIHSYNKLSRAEKKLFFVFIYYIVFAVVTLVYFGLSTGSQDKFVQAITKYFLCEVNGFDAENPCPRNYEKYTYLELAATSYLLLGFVPAVSLIFVVHVQKLELKVMKMCVKLHLISSYDSRDGPEQQCSTSRS